MNKRNCDSLKNLSVPDALIERALAIPGTVGDPPLRLPWYRRPSAVASAAAAVIVIGVTVSLAALFETKPALQVKDSASVTETAGETAPGVIPSAPEDTAPTAASTRPAATEDAQPAPTENKDRKIAPTGVTPTETVRIAPTEPAHAEPTAPAPVPSPTPVPTEAPVIQIPTEEPYEAPPEPTQSVPPTERPSEPPALEPEPTEPEPKNELTPIGFMVPLSSYSGSGDIFCRLYNSAGRMIGSEELFDESHLVYYTTGSGYLFLSYPLSRISEPLPPDNYTLVFYDADGNDFYLCSAYLSRR